MFVSHSDHGGGGGLSGGEGTLPGGVSARRGLCQEGVSGQWSAVGMHPTVITARKRSLGQGNIFIGVCQEFCSQWGGGLPQCMLEADPPSQEWRTPPRLENSPQEWRPPRMETPQECRIPPRMENPPKNGDPPTIACREIRSMRGRYASYWNAILLLLLLIL